MLVVAHGTIIKQYVKEFDSSLYEILKAKRNNFIIKVTIKNKELRDIDIVYKGYDMPNSNIISDIRSNCSLCNTFISLKNKSCQGKKELMDKEIHNKLIDKHFKI